MYHWENSNSNSKYKSNSKYNDPNYPTFSSSSSSSFLNKFNKSLKTHPSKSHQNEDIKTAKNRAKALEDEKMSSLRRACLVEKWMEKRVSDKVISRGEKKSNSRSSSTLLEEFDLQDTFFSSSTTNTTTTSSSSDEIDYTVFSHSKQKTLTTCFAPPRPKPIKTHSIESKFLNQFSQEKDEDYIKNRSRAAKVYSNLKNLKQPISPGVRLTSFINSLFTKEGKSSSKKGSKVTKHRKTEEITTTTTSYSTCSSASSFSRSCLLSKDKRFQDDGIKRTVRFCPVSVIVDDDSQPCGYKSLQEESENLLLNSKFKRSLSKRYQELKKLNGLERESSEMDIQNQKKLEEVALDLLSGYWDARLNKSHDLSSKIKGSNDDYGDNHGVNYAQRGNEDDDNDDDGFSCSSSDLFELDHLSLIGNELPVYETTQFDN